MGFGPVGDGIDNNPPKPPDDRGRGVGKAGVVWGRRRPAGKELIGQGIWIGIDPRGLLAAGNLGSEAGGVTGVAVGTWPGRGSTRLRFNMLTLIAIGRRPGVDNTALYCPLVVLSSVLCLCFAKPASTETGDVRQRWDKLML